LHRFLGSEILKKVQAEYNFSIKCHIIESNELASRTLETEKCYITYQNITREIDFVQLRIEKYTLGSRVPDIIPGTPEDDAYRRDLTINTMFIRLNDWVLEDFIGNGINDIKDKILRCPLEPYKTFIDDPLRIMRVLRFSVRYFDFNLIQSIDEIFTNVHQFDDLMLSFSKLSRERIYEELNKMGDNFGKFIKNIMKYPDLFEMIFLYKWSDEYVNTRTLSGLLFRIIINMHSHHLEINNGDNLIHTLKNIVQSKISIVDNFTHYLRQLKITYHEVKLIKLIELLNVFGNSKLDKNIILASISYKIRKDEISLLTLDICYEAGCEYIYDEIIEVINIEPINGTILMKELNIKNKEIPVFKLACLYYKIENRDIIEKDLLEKLILLTHFLP